MFEKAAVAELTFSEFLGDPFLGVHFHLESCVLFRQFFRSFEDFLLQFRLVNLKATFHGLQSGDFLVKLLVEAKNYLVEMEIAEVGGRGVENHGEKRHGCIREGFLFPGKNSEKHAENVALGRQSVKENSGISVRGGDDHGFFSVQSPRESPVFNEWMLLFFKESLARGRITICREKCAGFLLEEIETEGAEGGDGTYSFCCFLQDQDFRSRFVYEHGRAVEFHGKIHGAHHFPGFCLEHTKPLFEIVYS